MSSTTRSPILVTVPDTVSTGSLSVVTAVGVTESSDSFRNFGVDEPLDPGGCAVAWLANNTGATVTEPRMVRTATMIRNSPRVIACRSPYGRSSGSLLRPNAAHRHRQAENPIHSTEPTRPG